MPTSHKMHVHAVQEPAFETTTLSEKYYLIIIIMQAHLKVLNL